MIDNSDILRLASEANAARNAYDSAICKSLTGIIYGRRLIQAVDALTAAIADQFAQGAEGQDRESYTDTQDRDSYIVDTCCGQCPGGTCYVDQMTGA